MSLDSHPDTLRRLASSALLISLAAGCAAPGGGAQAEAPGRRDEETGYRDVVPVDADSETGVLTVHRVEQQLLFELPDTLLGRDLLLVSRIARVPADLAGGFVAAGHKAAEQVVRFERLGDRVLLRKVSHRNVADPEQAIHRSVVNNNFFPILAAFDVAAEGPPPGGAHAGAQASSVVVDVTSFFEDDVPAISGLSASLRKQYEVKGLDGERSFVNHVRAYPRNVEVRHTLTFRAAAPPTDAAAGTLSLEMNQSLILLPETPMRRRLHDPRVGWFTVRRTNFGSDAQKADEEEFLKRWRLEPADPRAYARGELVEPVQPIVYYLDPATPERWKPYVRQGVLDWQAAFESAGFRDAILARDAPTPEEDPDWSGEDVRYSVVRWAANGVRNAMGPSVADPRSGEILESDIVYYHNHLRSYRNRLLIETGAANPLARSLPVDDELLGEALRQVIAHEVGHALGLPHNMIASSAYPVESLRDPEFAARMGVAASVMDYARQNYVAQPGDGLAGADFVRRIGPYDHHAIRWGYRVVPDAATPEEERATLDAWIRERADDPRFRFGAQQRGLPVDPRAQTEDLGDDPVLASRYGLANLKRVVPRLLEWTSQPGEDYTDLEELYGETLGTYARYCGHVVALVGGVQLDLRTSDQDGRTYTPVAAGRQRAAVAFLAEEVFTAPTWLLDAEILRRIAPAGDVERVLALQTRVLHQLLDPSRLQRLVDAELELGARAYSLPAFLEDLRAAVWGDLAAPDAHRRALQRAHLARLEWLMTEDDAGGATPVDLATSDVRPLVRAQLRALEQAAASAAADADDEVLSAHLADVGARIAAFLEGRPLSAGREPR